jgi:tetratricopeptide (TPR) repeat protein
MNHIKTAKRILSLVCVLSLTGLTATVSAQDISKGPHEESVTKSTKADAVKRAGNLAKRLDKDKTVENQGPKGPKASLEEFKDQQQKMTPEQIDALKRQIEAKNKAMIAKLDRIIAGDPYNKQKPEWMFQKAELMWESQHWEYLRARAQYNQCLAASGQGTASSCKEPQPDYSESQKIYKKILTQYSAYSRLDQVIYRLGAGLIEAGKGAQAVSYLQRLVKNYPNSKFLPDANLALAEFFFEQELLGAARDKYQAVLKFKDNPNYDFAMYKLGWVYYNQGEYRKSVDTFKKVVERTNKKLGFQKQAINDLVVAYAEIEDGWIEVRDYLLKMRDKEFTYRKLAQMARLYEGQGKSKKAIAIYEYFIAERPDAPKIPAWMESIIIAKKKINDFEDLEKTMNTYVAYLDPAGTWAKKNQDNPGQLNNAALLSQASLAFLANTYHLRAQDHDTKEDYVAAIKYYKEFIRRFPDAPISFSMNFFVADIYLIELKNYEQAATYYQQVIDLYKAGNYPESAKKEEIEAFARDAAFGVVSAYNELVMKHHPDSILVKMAEYQEKYGNKEFEKEKVESGTETKPNPKVPLLKYEKGFVVASDQFSEMYPEEDITPTVDYVSAEVYKARGHYDKAIPRYESIIEHAPKHRYASYAGNSLLVANYVLKNWDEVEKWARYMLKNEIFDVTPKTDLIQAIALAINERAKELKEAEKFEKATAELLRLAKEFPDSKLAPGALFNAGAIYEAGDKLTEAVGVYERVVNDYPESLQAPEALFVMGAIFEARADFGKAANYFAQMGSTKEYVNAEGEKVEYKTHPKASEAVYNAAVLRAAMEQWAEAIATFEKYIKLYGDQESEQEQIKKVRLRMAYLEMKKGDPEAAFERFEDYLELDDVTPNEVVQINTELGLLTEKIKGRNWEEESNEYFNKALSTWKELDEENQTKMRFFAAQARFRQAERIYQDFTKVTLSFPMSKLTKGLEKKGKLEQEAEKIYLEVIQFKSPKWVAASAYRIGQMYRDFAAQLSNLPIPDGLTERQAMDYQWALDQKIIPLQDKALAAFQKAQELALQLQAYNTWSSKSAKQISTMQSSTYPITEQDGVEVGHGRVNFFVPEPMTDMTAIAKRVAERRAAQAPPVPKATPKAPGTAPTKKGAPAASTAPQASK